MNFPPRVILALVGIVVLLGCGVGALWVVARADEMPAGLKWLARAVVVGVVLATAAWIVYILPVYWD